MGSRITNRDGGLPKKLVRILTAFGVELDGSTLPIDLQDLVGKSIILEIVEGDDFFFNGEYFQSAKIESFLPWEPGTAVENE